MAKTRKLKPGDLAPDTEVLDINGDPVSLASLWAEGPTLLTFLRHFGWIHCREWLAQLEQHHEEIAAAGLQVVAIGLGEPKHARRYCGRLAPSATCFTCDSNRAHYTYGLSRGNVLRMVASPASVQAGMRAAARGHVQGRATGDRLMLPGTFVVDRDGVIQFAYYGQYAGDIPDLMNVIAVGARVA